MSTTQNELFASRHLGLTDADRAEMLRVIGIDSLEELIRRTVPSSILMEQPLDLPAAVPETDVLAALAGNFEGVVKRRSFIGQGYYPTVTPPVVKRNVLENPAWYTAYTPYQPEISQGRLEALLNFQTMITELTGLPLAMRPSWTKQPPLPRPSPWPTEPPARRRTPSSSMGTHIHRPSRWCALGWNH